MLPRKYEIIPYFVFPPHLSSASALPCEIGNPEDSALVHCACSTVPYCCSAIDFLSPEPTAPSWTHWLQNLGSHTAAWVWVVTRESKTLKKSSSWLNSDNALIQHLREKCIFAFPVLPGSAEAQVIWCGIVKCLLIAYFIGNISAKIYQNLFTCVKVKGSQRWDVFWDTVYISCGNQRCSTENSQDRQNPGTAPGLFLSLPLSLVTSCYQQVYDILPLQPALSWDSRFTSVYTSVFDQVAQRAFRPLVAFSVIINRTTAVQC